MKGVMTRPDWRRIGIAALWAGNAALLIVLAAAAYWLEVADHSDGSMLLGARRGDLARWPENTLEGIVAAVPLADAIEFDVRQSADGTFWLMHDPTVDRTTDGEGPIHLLSDEYLAGLTIDGGLGYTGQRGLRVPRLSSILDALASFDGLLIVDAKEGDLRQVAPMLRGRNAMVSIYTADQLAELRSVAPQLPVNAPDGIDADYVRLSSPLPPTAAFSRPFITAIEETFVGDESPYIQQARRWGAVVYLTNDLGTAAASLGRP